MAEANTPTTTSPAREKGTHDKVVGTRLPQHVLTELDALTARQSRDRPRRRADLIKDAIIEYIERNRRRYG